MNETLIINNTAADVIPYANIPYTLRKNIFNQELQVKHLHLLRPFYKRPMGDLRQLPRAPLIVYIGGGAWRSSTPWRHVPELCYYARRGYAVATIDYTLNNFDVFPAPLEDAKTAIRFLRAHAVEFGLDTERVAVMGDSAGAHLAALVGLTPDAEKFRTADYADMSDAVHAVVDFYGPTDFSELNVFDTSNPHSLYGQLFGATLADCPEEWRSADPISYVTKDAPPTMILHGTADTMIPIQHSENFYRALTQAGVETEYLRIQDAEHADVQFAQEAVLNRVLTFINKQIRQ